MTFKSFLKRQTKAAQCPLLPFFFYKTNSGLSRELRDQALGLTLYFNALQIHQYKTNK